MRSRWWSYVLHIDGIALAECTPVSPLDINIDGKKHILGLWEGATEDASVCKWLRPSLVERGLRAERSLVVTDGLSGVAEGHS